MRPSLDTASEQGAGPGCLAPFVRVRLAAFSGSDGFRGAGHRGAVGRHRQMERPQLVTCDTATRQVSRQVSRRPSRFGRDGRYINNHGGRHIPGTVTVTHDPRRPSISSHGDVTGCDGPQISATATITHSS